MDNPKPEITIDKGVPMPVASGRPKKYPFDDMKPSDSFFAGATKSHSMWHFHVKKNPGQKFVARTVTENGVKGTRVWRTA